MSANEVEFELSDLIAVDALGLEPMPVSADDIRRMTGRYDRAYILITSGTRIGTTEEYMTVVALVPPFLGQMAGFIDAVVSRLGPADRARFTHDRDQAKARWKTNHE